MSDGGRRQNLIKLASAATFLAVAVVLVLIVIGQSESSDDGGGDAGSLVGVAEVERELAGIPQDGLALGKSGARVTVMEFADLQCPFCKLYSEEVLPQVIESRVRSGEARLVFNNFVIIGPDSSVAGAAAVAAGEQGRGWNFVELFYRNQGGENSGYVTDEFLTAVAEGAGVSDIARWNSDRKSKRVMAQVEASTAEAEDLGFGGTPSVALEGPGTNGLEAIGTPESASDLGSAIESAS